MTRVRAKRLREPIQPEWEAYTREYNAWHNTNRRAITAAWKRGDDEEASRLRGESADYDDTHEAPWRLRLAPGDPRRQR